MTKEQLHVKLSEAQQQLAQARQAFAQAEANLHAYEGVVMFAEHLLADTTLFDVVEEGK